MYPSLRTDLPSLLPTVIPSVLSSVASSHNSSIVKNSVPNPLSVGLIAGVSAVGCVVVVMGMIAVGMIADIIIIEENFMKRKAYKHGCIMEKEKM
jgi:hypothetical protein